MVPPQGWRFETPHGELQAASLIELVKKVNDYRSANFMDMANAAEDIAVQICGKWPYFCITKKGGAAGGAPRAKAVSANVGNRVASWLTRKKMDKASATLVDNVTAVERAAVCRTCPRMIQAKPCCGRTVGALNDMARRVRSGRSEGSDLMHCSIMGFDCSVAVNLSLRSLEDTPATYAPDFCWLKKSQSA